MTLEIIHGPGLREASRALRERCVRDLGERFLWITSSERAARDLRAEIKPPPAASRIVSVQRLLELSEEPARVISRALLELVVTEAIEEDAPADGPFVNRRRLARAGAVRALADELIAHHGQGKRFASSKGEVSEEAQQVLARVESRLAAAGVLEEGESAHRRRAALTAERLNALFGRVDSAVVEWHGGFTADFHALLKALKTHAERVTLLVEDTPERPALRLHREEALGRLSRAARVTRVESKIVGAVDQLAEHFGLETRGKSQTPCEQVEIRTCRTPHDEAVYLARTIRKWARENPGRSLGRISVTFPSLARALPLVREVFSAWGIPHETPGEERRLSDAPLGQALLALAAVAADDFARRDLAALLRSRLWRAAYRLDADTLESVGRDLRVAQGLALWRARLRMEIEVTERLVQQPVDFTDDEQTTEQRREHLRRLHRTSRGLERMAADLEPLLRSSSPLEALLALRALFSRRRVKERLVRFANPPATPVAGAPHCGVPQRELRDDFAAVRAQTAATLALDRLINELEGAEWAATRARGAAEILPLLTRLLDATEISVQEHQTDAVQVIDPAEIPGGAWDLICVGGLVEGAWPRPPGTSPLRVNQEPDVDRDLAAQRHAFFEVLRAGAERMVFTRCAQEGDVPVNASPLFEEMARLAGREEALREPPWSIEEIATPSECFSARELMWVAGAALDGVIEQEPLSEIAQRIEAGGKALAAMRDGLACVQARRRPTWSAWEGSIQDPALLSLLRERAAHHVWSATELEAYAHCGWRACLDKLLCLRSPEDDEASLHRLERGRLIHEILCSFYRSWIRTTGRTRGDILPGEVDAACRVMHRVAEEALQRNPAGALLWDIERELLLGGERRPGLLEWFLGDEVERASPLAPVRLEWRFGWPSDRPPPRGTEGRAEALMISVDGVTLRVRGVIDRVDMSEDGLLWSVSDYKTGSSEIRVGSVLEGLHLQLPLYALAVARHLAGEKGRVAAALIHRVNRLDSLERKRIFEIKELLPHGTKGGQSAEEVTALLRVAQAHALTIARTAAAGDFHWSTRAWDEVCKHCEWSASCRREEWKVTLIGPPAGPLELEAP